MLWTNACGHCKGPGKCPALANSGQVPALLGFGESCIGHRERQLSPFPKHALSNAVACLIVQVTLGPVGKSAAMVQGQR